ncbi:probable calcium-binding protein CML46 [Malania oleifera]|uniref:probable calcium-binding protein CML46 n=1 Tax=Malania oleifera TaxID=397392 RepID=UPI0025ADC6DD|nr:probable calcium-binding protein CML46 [Malania oleifera]
MAVSLTNLYAIPSVSKSWEVDIFNWANSIHHFFSKFQSSFQSQLGCSTNLKLQAMKKNQEAELPGRTIAGDGKACSKRDVEMVMETMGIWGCDASEDEKHGEGLGCDEVSNLFEEEEPRLEEVEEAFRVFDENRDGFIDAGELQRLLCVLGFKEGSEIEGCNRMIRAYDENGDGRIDFNEFVKLMENSFC